MTKIYLIRHAEAEGNLYRRIQGHWDGSITALGLQQIDALAQRFRHEHIDALYCSNLSRARDSRGDHALSRRSGRGHAAPGGDLHGRVGGARLGRRGA